MQAIASKRRPTDFHGSGSHSTRRIKVWRRQIWNRAAKERGQESPSVTYYLKIDGAAVRTTGPALNQLLRDKVGQTVKLTIRRGNEEKVIDCKVAVVSYPITGSLKYRIPHPASCACARDG